MSDCFSGQQFLTVEQALTNILAHVKPLSSSKEISIEQALNTVLAKDVVSPMSVPPHNNSAMDGYAFANESLSKTNSLSLVGKSMAGAPFEGQCQLGQCVRIMTGGVLPADCDTVVMQEQCQVKDDSVSFEKMPVLGQNVRKKGEDIEQGQVILTQGKRLTAIDIALLASVGVPSVEVYQQVKVALIATGDELKTPGQTLGAGDIYESNRYFLTQMLTKLNVKVIDFGIIEDDVDAIRQAFTQADQQADVVISSGGVSVGEADYTKLVLDQLGQVGFWKIAMKPGKPLAFGLLPNSVFFGLPGNPVSAAVTFYQIAVHGINAIAGADPIVRPRFHASTVSRIKKVPGRMDFQRGIYHINEQGDICVESTGTQGSGVLSSIGKANCFIVLAKDSGAVEAGEKVLVEPFDALYTEI